MLLWIWVHNPLYFSLLTTVGVTIPTLHIYMALMSQEALVVLPFHCFVSDKTLYPQWFPLGFMSAFCVTLACAPPWPCLPLPILPQIALSPLSLIVYISALQGLLHTVSLMSTVCLQGILPLSSCSEVFQYCLVFSLDIWDKHPAMFWMTALVAVHLVSWRAVIKVWVCIRCEALLLCPDGWLLQAL